MDPYHFGLPDPGVKKKSAKITRNSQKKDKNHKNITFSKHFNSTHINNNFIQGIIINLICIGKTFIKFVIFSILGRIWIHYIHEADKGSRSESNKYGSTLMERVDYC